MTVIRLPDGTEQATFRYDFSLDSKAIESTVDENGDLWIEGYASDWGMDRQDEAFEPGAFERGLKAFLERNPIMLFHHQYDKALGQFVDARVDSNGLWVRGRVDRPAPGSWAEDVFNKIRKGTIKAFSVGGIFRRRGAKIYDCDLGEISVTPFPVNPRTTFAVVARKAFEGKAEEEVEQPPHKADPVETEKREHEREKEEAEREEPETIQGAPITGEQIKPGTITSEHIVGGSITVEHLSDDLRGRFSELKPEAPSIEEAHARLGTLATQLESVFNHIGIRPEPMREVVQAG